MRSWQKLLVAALGWMAGAVPAAELSLLDEYTVRHWDESDGLPAAAVSALRWDADGFLWCGTVRGWARFDGVQFVPGEPPVEQRVMGPPGAKLVGRGCYFDGEWLWREGETIALPARASPPTALVVDRQGDVWVSAAHGLFRWRAGQWAALDTRDGTVPWDLQVRTLTTDREANIWVGTSSGLLRLRRKRVAVWRTGLRLGPEAISVVWPASPTNLWVGVAGGGVLSGKPGEWQSARCEGLPARATVATICRRVDGTVWLGTLGDGVWQLPATGAAVAVAGPRGVSALLEDGRGQLWAGTWEGLWRWEGMTWRSNAVPVDAVTGMALDGEMVWVGFQNSGVFRLAPDGSTEHFLEGEAVRTVFVDSTGGVWVGTAHGLAWGDGARWHRFTAKNGLVDEDIFQVLEDGLGYLWLGTGRGLMRVKKFEFGEVVAGRKQVLPARVFGAEAGMADEECSGGLGARAVTTADGRLWFPTQDGIVVVDPATIPPQPQSCPAVIEMVQAGTVTIPVAARRVVRLSRGARAVTVHYTTPALTVPERAHFKYWLVGIDSNWSVATPERKVRYAQLSPGTHEFRVIARDRDGEWSEPAVVVIEVPPFWWEMRWVQWGLIGAGVLLVAGIVRLYDARRTARQVAELERRHFVERERARIARDIHDDVGAGLTEMAMLSELAKDEPTTASENLDRIFRRSGELTQSLDEIVWAINPRNDTLEGFLSYIAEFSQRFLSTAGVACRLDFPRDPPALPMNANLRHHLCLAIKEILNNVIKHASASVVHVRVGFLRGALSVVIEDDGVGFGEPAAGEGLGNLEARMQELGGSVQRTSGPEQGTQVRLTVPLAET